MPLTKTTALLTVVLGCSAVPASAGADHNYELVGVKAHPFDVYNDGKNTYVEIVRGLVVPGSKREGDSYVVDGVQSEIAAQYGGKKISIKLRTPLTARNSDTYTYALDSAQAVEPPPASARTSAESAEATRAQSVREDEMLAEVRERVKAQVVLEIQAIEKARAAASTSAPANEAKSVTEPKKPTENLPPEQTAKQPPAAPVAPVQEAEVKAPELKSDRPAAVDAKSSASPSPKEAKQSAPQGQINEAIQVSEKVLFSEQPTTEAKALNVIKKGRLIDDALQERAVAEGWTFSWNSKKHWEAIADIDISKYKTADEAVEDIVNGLREEGKPIQLRISEGNKVMEVFSTEVKND